MNKLFFPPLLIFFQFFFSGLGWSSWSYFNGTLAVAVMYAFFHNLDQRDILLYAVFCGLCRDLFSLDVFGLSALSYAAIVFPVSLVTRFINRHNGAFVFPVIFLAAWVCPYLSIAIKAFLGETAVSPSSGMFFVRSFLEAAGTTALTVPLYFYWRLCGLVSIES